MIETPTTIASLRRCVFLSLLFQGTECPYLIRYMKASYCLTWLTIKVMIRGGIKGDNCNLGKSLTTYIQSLICMIFYSIVFSQQDRVFRECTYVWLELNACSLVCHLLSLNFCVFGAFFLFAYGRAFRQVVVTAIDSSKKSRPEVSSYYCFNNKQYFWNNIVLKKFRVALSSRDL